MNLRLPDYLETEKRAVDAVETRESGDCYPAIAYLSDRVRVINCKDDMQWIVQERINKSGQGWRGQSFCCTKAVLLRGAEGSLTHPIPAEALAILNALPDWHPDRSP